MDLDALGNFDAFSALLLNFLACQSWILPLNFPYKKDNVNIYVA